MPGLPGTSYVATAAVTYCATRCWDWIIKSDPPAAAAVPVTRGVASQAQCTYTALRGVATPRFQLLPDAAQGRGAGRRAQVSCRAGYPVSGPATAHQFS